LLGDINQLPSIGPGKILNQLIKSEIFTVTKLTKIKRQESGALVNNILKMTKEIVTKNDFNDNTMVLLDVNNFIIDGEISRAKIIDFVYVYNLDKENTKFITSFNKEKFIFNTKKLNNILQDIFNSLKEDYECCIIPSNNKYENSYKFRVNDKIIRTENDYSSKKMRANGEEAKIVEFDGNKVTIQYSGPSDKEEEIGIDELYENFILNYCVTIHKSQGSQYFNVVFLIEPNCTIIEKKAIYTAISRSKNRCLIISNESDFIKLQNNNKMLDKKVSLYMEFKK
jgi:exodeoxyribonuclease V alpha subunit